MRFGIMVMQLDMLVPSDPAPQAALAHLANFDPAALVRRLALAGFNLIELGGDLTLFFPQSYSPQSVERLAALKQELGLSYTVHLPLWSVEPSTPLAPVRQGSVRAVIEIIKATRPLAPEVYVLHATGTLATEFYRMRLPEQAHTLILRQFANYAGESIQAILSETDLPSRQLAVETIEFPFDLTLDLAERFNLSICLDAGHVLSGFSGPFELFDVLERCLPRLAEIHLHDSPWLRPGQEIRYGKDHQPLGKGDLDVGRLLDRLAGANFTGPLIFELRVAQALASLDVVRSIRPGLVI
jgi:sugar phosphate isomerase/epimerase